MRTALQTLRVSSALASSSSSMLCPAMQPASSTSRRCEASSAWLLPPTPRPAAREALLRLATKGAELKFLNRAPGRDVLMPPAVDQFKAVSQDGRQGCGVVAADKKAAASLRPIRRERGDDGMSARTQGAPEPLNIGDLFVLPRKEVKGRAVVPDIVGPRRIPSRHIRCYPRHRMRLLADPRSGSGKRGGRQIEHRQVLVAALHQAIGKPRCSAADVDNAGACISRDKLHEFKRERRGRLKPAHLVFRLADVHVLPMRLAVSFVHRFPRSRKVQRTSHSRRHSCGASNALPSIWEPRNQYQAELWIRSFTTCR